MTTEKFETYTREKIRLPEVSRRASEFLAAVETATPENPASIDLFARNGTATEVLEEQLDLTDTLYRRHDELFLDARGWPRVVTDLDLEAILALSKHVATHTRSINSLSNGISLAFGVLQLAEAGSQLAQDPGQIVVDIGSLEQTEDISTLLQHQGMAVIDKTFRPAFGQRIKANTSMPGYINGYPGFLQDVHLAFWQAFCAGRRHLGYSVDSDIRDEVRNLLHLFSAKKLRFDTHSITGRPDRSLARAMFVDQIETFQRAQELGEVEPKDMTANFEDAMAIVLEVLDIARKAGYSLEVCLRIVMQNSDVIGSLTERTGMAIPRFGEGISLDGSRHRPRLVINYAQPTGIALEDERITIRDQKGGGCPARYLVRLQKDGEFHHKIQTFANAVARRIGEQPPLVITQRDEVFVDPAALMVNYVLFTIAHNV